MPAALREIGLTGEMKEIEVDARVGGTFLFSDLRNGVEARHWGSYLELERPHKIAFTWITDVNDEADPSKVSLTIAPADDGCVADMVHEIDAKWAEFAERIGQSWARMLRAIANELAR